MGLLAPMNTLSWASEASRQMVLTCLAFRLEFLICVCVWECFACMVCVPCMLLVPVEVRRRCQLSWNWIYSCELPCDAGNQGSPGRATTAEPPRCSLINKLFKKRDKWRMLEESWGTGFRSLLSLWFLTASSLSSVLWGSQWREITPRDFSGWKSSVTLTRAVLV